MSPPKALMFAARKSTRSSNSSALMSPAPPRRIIAAGARGQARRVVGVEEAPRAQRDRHADQRQRVILDDVDGDAVAQLVPVASSRPARRT